MRRSHIRTRVMGGLVALSFALGLILGLSAGQSAAETPCFAEYRAQRMRPVRLHYGVAMLPPQACEDLSLAQQILSDRLAANGWTGVDILSIFGPEGLDERRERAGEFFLRY